MKRLDAARAALLAVGTVCILGAAPVKSAPDFTLPDTGGKPVNFMQARDGKKAVLVNFWATWCPSCREEIPALIELQKKYAAEGFEVIGVDVGESAARVTSAVQKYSMAYPVVLDADSRTAKAYGVVGLPVSVLVDAQGGVIAEYHEFSGAIEKDIKRVLQK